MTRDQARTIDPETLAAQLHEYVLEPLHSPGFTKAVQQAMNACRDFAAQVEAEEHRKRHPRVTDNLHKLHRRYRRPL